MSQSARVSTEGAAFTELLATLRGGAMAGFPAAPAPAAPAPAAPAPAAPAPAAPAPAAPATGTAPIPTMNGAAAPAAAAPARLATSISTAYGGATDPTAAAAPGPTVHPAPAPSAPAAAPASTVHPAPAASAPGLAASLAAALAALGVPEEVARLADGSDQYAATVWAMSALPAAPPPPAADGDVLVIVGEPEPASELADQLAEAMLVDPEGTLVAAPTAASAGVPAERRILGPADADRRARRLHVDDVPHVVVVAAPVDGSGGEWVRAVTKALRPTAVWALVDSTRKTADIARYLRSLGPVDALAVHGTPASADPATVLHLGLPVAYLDGQPATPNRWAALLCERLAEARALSGPEVSA
jgi:hypothetical protein